MQKHKAIIIGAGRMGSGYGLKPGSHYYTHAKAYMDLKDRVELVGFIEPDAERRMWATGQWGVKGWPDFTSWSNSEAYDVDVWSVCTQPEQRGSVMDDLCQVDNALGAWVEKPYSLGRVVTTTNEGQPIKIQVNYCRRFDLYHQAITLAMTEATDKRLVVMAKKDVHTVCHMTDLARFWRARLDYVDTPNEPGAYALRYKTGGDWKELFFPAGGISGDAFMKNALGNLLDAMEGKAPLISPPENAVESEKWASEILKG
jgi:hypothetical protein